MGRPVLPKATKDAIRDLLRAGQSERAVVEQLGVSRGAALAASVGPRRRERNRRETLAPQVIERPMVMPN